MNSGSGFILAYFSTRIVDFEVVIDSMTSKVIFLPITSEPQDDTKPSNLKRLF